MKRGKRLYAVKKGDVACYNPITLSFVRPLTHDAVGSFDKAGNIVQEHVCNLQNCQTSLCELRIPFEPEIILSRIYNINNIKDANQWINSNVNVNNRTVRRIINMSFVFYNKKNIDDTKLLKNMIITHIYRTTHKNISEKDINFDKIDTKNITSEFSIDIIDLFFSSK